MTTPIKDINNNIYNLYKKKTYFNTYGGEIFVTIFIFLVFFIVFSYLYINNNLKSIQKNWAYEKCNPFYMPFAGYIANFNKNVSNNQFTMDNFNSCIQSMQQSSANYTLDPINFIINTIQSIFSVFGDIISSIINLFSQIIAFVKNIMNWCQNTLLNMIVEISKIIEKMRDTFNKSVGVVITVMFYQILNIQFAFLWTVLTPVWSVATGLLGSIPGLILAIAGIVEAISIITAGEAFELTAGILDAMLPIPFVGEFIAPFAAAADIIANIFIVLSSEQVVWLVIYIAWAALITLWIICLFIMLVVLIIFNNSVFAKIKVQNAPTFPL